MGKCCDTCGNIGAVEALATCSRCKLSRHMYCMGSQVSPDNWCCEECESGFKLLSLASSSLTRVLPSVPKSTTSAEVPTESRKLSKEPRKGPVDWEKKVVSGKTKYISVNEVIKLSSGSNKTLPNLNVTGYSNSPHPRAGLSKAERMPKRPKTILLNSSSQQDLASRPSQQLISQNICSNVLSEVQQQQSQSLTDINSCTIPELRTSKAENINAKFVPDSEDCSFTPSLDALWKGSFNFLDDIKHRTMSHEIRAHSPYLVRRKVYDFSKKMPEILHFEMVPCEEIWLKLFPEYFPDRRDIGLYFFPSNSIRADDYTSLLECITAKNLALRKQIADVEILVFASKLLPVDCQFWQGNYFLWGVFHKLKGNATSCLNIRKSPVQNLEDVNYCCREENDNDVDMEIDMIGGINVGRVDFVVQRKSSKEQSTTVEHANSVTRNTGLMVPSLSVKLEPPDDIPPGFEETFRLRNSSPLGQNLKEK